MTDLDAAMRGRRGRTPSCAGWDVGTGELQAFFLGDLMLPADDGAPESGGAGVSGPDRTAG